MLLCFKFGGAGRNRTDDGGVAVHSITTLLPRPIKLVLPKIFVVLFMRVGRILTAYGLLIPFGLRFARC